LKRAIERHVVYPLANLLATDQVSLGDVISIDWDGVGSGLLFSKEAEGALVPMPSPGLATAAAAAAIPSSRTVPVPRTMAAAEWEPLRPTR
jgi:ATP-dependent Clp protease ATP-binding subunit ClpB